MRKMLKILFAVYIVFILLDCNAFGQQNHFIYIQADDKQTFSVQVNNKMYKSSDIGYVIIPKLTDGKYQLNISFPDKKYPDQQFNCLINKADAGYALKNFGDKGWGLFNFESLEVTMAGDSSVVAEVKTDTTKTRTDTTMHNDTTIRSDTVKPNAFGEMLSQVVNDTSLKVSPVEQPANKQQSVPSAETNKQPAAIVTVPMVSGDSSKNAQNQMQPTDTLVVLNRSMRKIAELQTDDGVNMVFVDPASGNDTIKIFVPSTKEKVGDSAVAKNKAKDLTVDTTQSTSEIKKEDKNALSDTSQSQVSKNSLPDTSALQSQVNNPFFSGKQAKDTASQTAVENNPAESKPGETTSSSAYRSDCKKMFSDNDLDKLKKKLAGNSVDKMLQAAKKYFQDKCITTEQVKSLVSLFQSDDARYSFFDVAYPNVYDISTFPSLENQLIDPYYKKRFRAMLR